MIYKTKLRTVADGHFHRILGELKHISPPSQLRNCSCDENNDNNYICMLRWLTVAEVLPRPHKSNERYCVTKNTLSWHTWIVYHQWFGNSSQRFRNKNLWFMVIIMMMDDDGKLLMCIIIYRLLLLVVCVRTSR